VSITRGQYPCNNQTGLSGLLSTAQYMMYDKYPSPSNLMQNGAADLVATMLSGLSQILTTRNYI